MLVPTVFAFRPKTTKWQTTTTAFQSTLRSKNEYLIVVSIVDGIVKQHTRRKRSAYKDCLATISTSTSSSSSYSSSSPSSPSLPSSSATATSAATSRTKQYSIINTIIIVQFLRTVITKLPVLMNDIRNKRHLTTTTVPAGSIIFKNSHRTYNSSSSSKSNKVFLRYTPRDPRLRFNKHSSELSEDLCNYGELTGGGINFFCNIIDIENIEHSGEQQNKSQLRIGAVCTRRRIRRRLLAEIGYLRIDEQFLQLGQPLRPRTS